MAGWRKVFVFAAFLPGMAAAADPAMLELIMPDARTVTEINLDRIASSPIGHTVSSEMKNELQNLRVDLQQSLANFNGLDWSHYAQEVIFASAGGPGKGAASLVIVRGLLDPAWIESLSALRGTKGVYMGVPTLTSGGSTVAFLDGSIAVAGRDADVKAALRRRGLNTPPSPVLATGLERFEGQYDAWMVSAGPVTVRSAQPAPAVAADPAAQNAPPAPTPAASGNSLRWLQHVDAFAGGLRVSPDFELSVNMTMRNEKDVADMADGLKWFSGVVQTQAGTAASLDDIKFEVEGKRISFALQVPEQQVRAALQQRQGGPRPRTAAVRPPDIGNGMPELPSGTIRVQSSPRDMGTVLLPVDKTK